jgi:ribosome biogenesis GTPase
MLLPWRGASSVVLAFIPVVGAVAGAIAMTTRILELTDFGWNAFFAAQLDSNELAALVPVRVMAVHRGRIDVAGPAVETQISTFVGGRGDEETAATVGDWLLLDRNALRPRRLLTRVNVFKRRAAGTGRRIQLIAANVDTLFIVSSCNHEFNLARLERYLALADNAKVTPIAVLTKSDLTTNAEEFASSAGTVRPHLLVKTLDARNPASVASLLPWCGRGQTVAMVGSSGVGKSTLINTLIGHDRIATQVIREDDDEGRHTTTGRALHRMRTGGLLLDTPGMRELQLTDVESGLANLFADIVALAETCRFNDCRHKSEPGCAVLAAVESGTLSAERVKRWRKLNAEEAYNTRSLSERRARDRSFGKLVRRATKDKRSRHGE